MNKPAGLPFSHLYIDRPAAGRDSTRARARLTNYIDQLHFDVLGEIVKEIQLELGADVRSSNCSDYLRKCPVPALLDTITYVWRKLPEHNYNRPNTPTRRNWAQFVSRVFNEEALAYTLDEAGGVHFAPDKEFSASVSSTISILSRSRFSAAHAHFEQGLAELKSPQLYGSAVRRVFDACESVFKVLTAGKHPRLGDTELEKAFRPRIAGLTSSDQAAAGLMLSSLKSWVNAAHQFRHAGDTEALEPPSLELAIWMFSTGAAHLRWLAELDQHGSGQPDAP